MARARGVYAGECEVAVGVRLLEGLSRVQMSGQVFFEGSKDVRDCAGLSVRRVLLSLIVLLGYAERESGYLWYVGVLVLVEAWAKVVAFDEVGARPSPANAMRRSLHCGATLNCLM